MKQMIRRWLGIAGPATTDEIKRRLDAIDDGITALRADLSVTMYMDEMDPRRKKMSDELGEKMRQKLIAEDKARRHTLGEL